MITQVDSSSRIKMESGNQMFWPGNMIFCRNWGQTGAKQLRKWEYARSKPLNEAQGSNLHEESGNKLN